MDATTFDLLDYDQYFFYLGNNAGNQVHASKRICIEIEELYDRERMEQKCISKMKIVKNPLLVLLYCTFTMYRPRVYSISQR